MSFGPPDLEEIVDGWEYWCPDKMCRNRTFKINTEARRLPTPSEKSGEQKYLTVRVLVCERCSMPLVMGTSVYYNREKGWDARGQTITASNSRMSAAASIMSRHDALYEPIEYIAFMEPVSERPLPDTLPKKIVGSFREAEYAIDKNKPIAAAATIRNTVRLIVEDNKITGNLRQAIKKLPFEKEYLVALGNMKIMGDDTLHYEEYAIKELRPALETLHLALGDYYARKQRLAQLHKAVSDKASKRAKQ